MTAFQTNLPTFFRHIVEGWGDVSDLVRFIRGIRLGSDG